MTGHCFFERERGEQDDISCCILRITKSLLSPVYLMIFDFVMSRGNLLLASPYQETFTKDFCIFSCLKI